MEIIKNISIKFSVLDFRKFWDDQGGTVAITSALTAIILFGFAGLAIDVTSWMTAKRSMQGAADAAAYAAGIAYSKDDGTDIPTQAKAVSAANGYVDAQNGVTVTVNQPPTSGNYKGDSTAIQVIIQQPQAMFFSSLFLSSGPVVQASAVVALVGSPSNSCMIALDSGNPPNVNGIVGAGDGGLNVSGGGTMSLSGCDIFVNAQNSESIDVTGGGTLEADNISTQGGVSGTVTANKKLNTYTHPAAADPYASTRSIPSWSTDGCDPTTSVSGSVSNPMGVKVYCSGIQIKGTTTFAPGVYIINNGSMSSSATINGSGVTFILTSKTPSTDTGVFNMSSGATLNLTAPTSGTTAGITLWADTNLPHGADNFKAGSVSNITGAVYLPSHMVNYSGSAKATSTCFQLVAAEIAISGGANFTHTNCSGVGIEDPPLSGGSTTKLVE